MTKKSKVAGKRPFSIDLSGPSPTQQHFKDEADVNNIVAHYAQTGIDPYIDRLKRRTFGYATSQTFEEAMRNTAEVNSAFEDLPSEVRQGFSNDPGQWIDSMAGPPPQDETIVPPEAPEEPPIPDETAPDSAEKSIT